MTSHSSSFTKDPFLFRPIISMTAADRWREKHALRDAIDEGTLSADDKRQYQERIQAIEDTAFSQVDVLGDRLAALRLEGEGSEGSPLPSALKGSSPKSRGVRVKFPKESTELAKVHHVPVRAACWKSREFQFYDPEFIDPRERLVNRKCLDPRTWQYVAVREGSWLTSDIFASAQPLMKLRFPECIKEIKRAERNPAEVLMEMIKYHSDKTLTVEEACGYLQQAYGFLSEVRKDQLEEGGDIASFLKGETSLSDASYEGYDSFVASAEEALYALRFDQVLAVEAFEKIHRDERRFPEQAFESAVQVALDFSIDPQQAKLELVRLFLACSPPYQRHVQRSIEALYGEESFAFLLDESFVMTEEVYREKSLCIQSALKASQVTRHYVEAQGLVKAEGASYAPIATRFISFLSEAEKLRWPESLRDPILAMYQDMVSWLQPDMRELLFLYKSYKDVKLSSVASPNYGEVNVRHPRGRSLQPFFKDMHELALDLRDRLNERALFTIGMRAIDRVAELEKVIIASSNQTAAMHRFFQARWVTCDESLTEDAKVEKMRSLYLTLPKTLQNTIERKVWLVAGKPLGMDSSKGLFGRMKILENPLDPVCLSAYDHLTMATRSSQALIEWTSEYMAANGAESYSYYY